MLTFTSIFTILEKVPIIESAYFIIVLSHCGIFEVSMLEIEMLVNVHKTNFCFNKDP